MPRIVGTLSVARRAAALSAGSARSTVQRSSAHQSRSPPSSRRSSGRASPSSGLFLISRPTCEAAASISDRNKRGEPWSSSCSYRRQESGWTAPNAGQKQVRFTPFWITNAIYVEQADQQLLMDTAARSDVVKILAQEMVRCHRLHAASRQRRIWLAPSNGASTRSKRRRYGTTLTSVAKASSSPTSTPASSSTTPRWSRQYRGRLANGTFDHNYNWFDPSQICGNPSLVPCDNDGHGTHTMGTMVGDDGAGNQIGVAPDARWIAAKGCEASCCTDDALLASGQWMLAPTDLNGRNARADLRPHIVNNSWGERPAATVFQRDRQRMGRVGYLPGLLERQQRSGLPDRRLARRLLGQLCRRRLRQYDEIARFSSRGPSRLDGGIKPNIAAPGVSVRSTVPDNVYLGIDGTSMASPHVAGASRCCGRRPRR